MSFHNTIEHICSGHAPRAYWSFTDKITLEESCNTLVLLPNDCSNCSSHCTLTQQVHYTLEPPSNLNPNAASNTMADFHVIHAYLCGHFDSSLVPGASSPQYVFVNGGCSDFECRHTDTNWLKQQGTLPTPKDMALLADYSRQLTTLQSAADKYATDLPTADPSKLQRIADAGFPSLLDLAFSENPYDHADSTFHISTLKTLLRYARQFAKSSKTKPFFDLCMDDLAYFLRDATVADGLMIKGIKAFSLMMTDSDRLVGFRQWPGARNYYQSTFGTTELEALHAAGVAGKEILRQPLNAGTLHIADLTVRTLAQRAPVAAACPRPTLKLTIPHKAGLPKPTLDLEAWLAQEEAAFVAELKRTAAKKSRRMARSNRIMKIGCVGTDVNRVFKQYLPKVEKCA